ncbi:MAG: TPM domain-containing protein [Candidatus Rokuibacteriota bacterium]
MLLPFLVLTLVVPPAPDARVSDYAGLLAADARARLEQRLAERERATGAQMAIAIFPGLEGESLEDFSIRLAQRWRIGRKGLDNGVILVVFVRDRKVRMEVGYGLEGLVPDSVAAQIIREALGPRFREQRYAAGLEAAVDAVFARIALERDVGIWRQRQKDAEQTALFHTVAFILIGGAIVLGLAREVMRQRGGYAARGRGWASSGSGRSGGGGSSGGSSDSSFSGGGGSFGGGGASGDW